MSHDDASEATGYAFILGGTHGLGAAIAEQCLLRAWRTVRVGRSVVDADTMEGRTFGCDLSQEWTVRSLLRRLDEGEIRIRRFFWVAGTLKRRAFADQPAEDVVEVIDVNLRNAALVALWAWKQLVAATEPSSFTVVSSTAGVNVRPGQAAYTATKHAQVGLIRTLAAENTNANLLVSLFLPGGMKTRQWERDPHPEYETFLEPGDVAARIVKSVEEQSEPFIELVIPRRA